MKNRWIIFALILSLVFNVAFLGTFGYRLFEKKRDREKSSHHEERKKEKSEEKGVELRPEQRAQLKNIREEFFPQIKEIRAQLHKERKELGRLLMEEKTDSVAIGKQVEQIESLQTDIERKVIRQLLKEKLVLDPEQRQNYLRMIMKRIHAPLPLGPLPEEEEMRQKHNQ